MTFQRAIFGFTDIVEQKLTQSIEGDAFHKPSRDDAIGVYIVTRNWNGSSGYLCNFF